MKWLPQGLGGCAFTSDCGIYELRASYTDGHYAWRARVIDTDVLVASSHDRNYVEQCVYRHKASALVEAP